MINRLMECHFVHKNFTYYGTNEKKGYFNAYPQIMKAMRDVLKKRHVGVTTEDVTKELKNYFKYIGEVCKRSDLKKSKLNPTTHEE